MYILLLMCLRQEWLILPIEHYEQADVHALINWTKCHQDLQTPKATRQHTAPSLGPYRTGEGRTRSQPAIPCLLDLNAAAELLQHVLPSVMVDDEHTVFLIWPLVPFEHRHWRGGPLFATKA